MIRLFFDILQNMETLKQVRIRSCYSNDYIWPVFVVFLEIVCNLIPLWCFTYFFSTKIMIARDD